MHALGNVDPAHVIASAAWDGAPDNGAVTWQLLARAGGGLVVVTASAGAPWQWQHGSHAEPEDAVLSARRFPLSRIVSIGVADVRVWDDQSLSVTDLAAHHSWVLTVDGEPLIVVRPDGRETTPQRHRAFFEKLMEAV
jgi:hypothetical protein